MAKLSKNPLSKLLVLDRLEVGPPTVTARRLAVPYTVRRGDATETTELVYRYEEDVFDPVSPACRNLASMIGAQVALNYGLLCREIVFRGDYDDTDRAFLQTYASNTAREIYVMKLLHPNPYLTGVATDVPVVKLDDYCQAKLTFADPAVASRTPWPSERSGHAVLSSGGKDSLLTYGLLDEIGHTPHSIFLNESGRHWFTALNAFRHLRDRDPRTARVWTNSDRVFAWMLRRLPFIRADFGRIRSDEYPIRLWTVAVFSFGALPLLRKRGVGRLLIGDEYDTTARARFKGITHYGGLYDQSRYFDDAMSRYFGAKGWGVRQFSVLRTLSEMLIQKTLVERYPDLQRHQMSCHATHEEGGRIRPCGKCEKCRRIVGMLLGFGGDPATSGYSRSQIDACLADVAEKGVHQERPAAEHLTWLLANEGLIADGGTAHEPRRDPRVLRLRVDPERSPIEGIPVDLRKPVYGMLLEHAEGAVRRHGRHWRKFDLLAARAIDKPYRFEREPKPGSQRRASAKTPALDDRVELGPLTWPEAEARLARVDVALLPVGAIEQHGAHLPLDTDAYDAERLACDVAAACSSPKPIVLPLVPYGVSYHHEDFRGTISVDPGTLAALIHDIGMSAADNGIRKLVIINGHGGNGPALHFAAQTINCAARIFTCVDSGESSDADVFALAETPNDVHAGEIETSTTLYLRPELVQMDKAQPSVMKFSTPYLDFTSKHSVAWYGRTARITRSGVFGDPTKATRAKGERMWKLMIEHLVTLVEELKESPLEELFDGRG